MEEYKKPPDHQNTIKAAENAIDSIGLMATERRKGSKPIFQL